MLILSLFFTVRYTLNRELLAIGSKNMAGLFDVWLYIGWLVGCFLSPLITKYLKRFSRYFFYIALLFLPMLFLANWLKNCQDPLEEKGGLCKNKGIL